MLLIYAGNSYLFEEQVEGNAILSSRCVLRNWVCSFQRCAFKKKIAMRSLAFKKPYKLYLHKKTNVIYELQIWVY